MIWGENRFSYPMYRDFRDHNTVFEDVAARFPTALNLSYNNRSERIQAELVSGTWFDTLGLTTSLGRGLTVADDLLPGAHPVVVLTYDYWKSRFNGNSGILNQTVLLNGHPMTVVGVAAPGYHGFDPGARVDALVPTMMKAEMTPTWNGLSDRRILWLQLVGRLRAGVSPRQAQASLEPYYHGLLIMEMQTMKFRTERSRSGFATKPLIFVPAGKGLSDLRQQFSNPLLILLGIVGLLLLIACANVANLLLARAAGRQKEIAIRLAVGASRFLLVRQLIAESLVLSLAGGAIGILFAWWTGGALLSLLPNSADLPLTASPDLRVFAFTFALSLLTGVLFGLAPAWQATSPRLAVTLKDHAGNVSAGGGHVRLRKALVVSQVALSLLMLIAAALFTRSLHNLKNVDLGFRRERLLSFALDPSLAGYKAERIRRFAEDVQTRVAATSRVQSAAVGVMSVITGDQNMSTISIEGYQPKDDQDMTPWFDTVSPGYFQTMGIPLLAGRDFTVRDRIGAPRVAVVNDVFANYYFPNENPIGRHFGVGRGTPRAISKSSAWCGGPSTPKSMRRHRERSTSRLRRTRIRVRWWSTHAPRAIPRRSSRRCGAKSTGSIQRSPSPACAPWKIRSTSRSPRSAPWPASRPSSAFSPRCWPPSGYTASWRTRSHGARAKSASDWRWAPDAPACSSWYCGKSRCSRLRASRSPFRWRSRSLAW